MASPTTLEVSTPSPSAAAPGPADPGPGGGEPVLCGHCGRTASNGISCQGHCVADSGY